VQTAACAHHAGLKRIHIQVAQQDGAMMSLAGLHVGDGARQLYRLEDLALIGEAELAGQVRGDDEDGLAPGQAEAANRYPAALEQRPQQLRVEASEEDEVIADTPGVLIIGCLSVEFFQNPFRTHGALGQDEHVDIFFARQGTDEAGDLALVQVPEEKACHRLV
jgi:hypothetical protein